MQASGICKHPKSVNMYSHSSIAYTKMYGCNCMVHGKLNHEVLIRVIERILTARYENADIKVRLITVEEAEEINKQKDKIMVRWIDDEGAI